MKKNTDCQSPAIAVVECIHEVKSRKIVSCGSRWAHQCMPCVEKRQRRIRGRIAEGSGVGGYYYYFVTLTMPGKSRFKTSGAMLLEAKACFKRWRTWWNNTIKRDFGDKDAAYFWVFEPQKRGAWHFHLAVRTTKKIRTERKWIKDNRSGRRKRRHVTPMLTERTITSMGFGWNYEWAPARHKEAPVSYMSKYLTKLTSPVAYAAVTHAVEILAAKRPPDTNLRAPSVRLYGSTSNWKMEPAPRWSLKFRLHTFTKDLTARLSLPLTEDTCCAPLISHPNSRNLLEHRMLEWFKIFENDAPQGCFEYLKWSITHA